MATCQNAIRGTNEYHLTVTFDEAESIRDAVFESPCEYLDDVYHDLNVLLNNYGDGIVNLTIGLTEEQAVCLLRALMDAPSSDTDEAFWALTTALESEGITMPYICECDGCNWDDGPDDDGDPEGGAPAAPAWANNVVPLKVHKVPRYTGGEWLAA